MPIITDWISPHGIALVVGDACVVILPLRAHAAQSTGVTRQAGHPTTPVVYLYLDRLSEAFSRWGRSSVDHDEGEAAGAAARQAAE